MCIATPKGYDTFHDLFILGDLDANWRSYHYDYNQSPYLDEEEISAAARKMDPIRFAREYLARFEDSGNNVFYTFDRGLS